MARHRGPCKKGFSLIELIAVIAILALLAALVFPAIQSGRDTAISTGCKNSLRQLATAHFRIASDHGGWCVPFIIYYDDGTYAPNIRAGDPPVNPYPGGERWNRHLFVASYGVGPFDLYAGCRAATSYFSLSKDFRDRYPHAGVLQMYIMAYGGLNGQRRYRGTSFARMSSPSTTLFLADAVAWGGVAAITRSAADPAHYDLYGESTVHGTPVRVAYRHFGRANGAFYDGHVESLTAKELLEKPEYWLMEN